MADVLQVIQQGQLRGAEMFALDLAQELTACGPWQVSLLSLGGVDAAYAAAAVEAGLAVDAVGQHGPPVARLAPALTWRLRASIERRDYQIVQANGAGTLKYLVAARRLSRRPWRLVYRAIGMGSYWRRGTARRLAYRWLLAQPDLVVAVGRAVADDLVRRDRVDPRRVAVLPNGVRGTRIASGRSREDVRAELGVPSSEPLLVYVGSLTREKNVSALVDVVAALRQQGLPVHALIAGAGEMRESLQARAARRGVADVVHLRPPLPHPGDYLAAADVFVLPSLSEGMPAALIEAGMAGLPGVAFAVGGVPEIVEDGVTGRLAPPGDQDGLTRRVAALVADGSRRAAMGDAARARYRRFEIAVVAPAYQEAYTRLVEASRPA